MKRYPSFIKYYVFLLISLVFFTLTLSFPSYCQDTPALTIAIIQPRNIGAYQEAVEGFLQHLRKYFKQGFNAVVYENTEGLYHTIDQNKKKLQRPGIDLILTVGTEATSDVSHKINDIPIVFAMVLNPTAILKHRHDIVGASLNIPIEFYLRMIKEALPAVKTIGIIYDPTKNADFVEKSVRVAEAFELQIRSFPVKSQKNIPTALKQVNKEADALWGIVDNTVYTSQTAGFIIRDTVKGKMPFIGLSPLYVKAGALCSLGFENKDIGRQAAELAQQILAGTPVAELHTTIPEKINLAINLYTAKIIGVEIPQKILEKATIVYE